MWGCATLALAGPHKTKKNVAFTLLFGMVDSDDPTLMKSCTVTDDCDTYTGGSWSAQAITDTAAQSGTTGMYALDFTAAEANHDYIACKFTCTGGVDNMITIVTNDADVDDLVRSTTPANTFTVGAAGYGAANLEAMNGVTARVDELKDFCQNGWDTVNDRITEVHTINQIEGGDATDALDTALSDIHLDHLLAVAFDSASPEGVATSLWNELTENDGTGLTRFTQNTLEEGIVAEEETMLFHTSVFTVNSQTEFEMTDGPDTNDAINGHMIVIFDSPSNTPCIREITDYASTFHVLTIDSSCEFGVTESDTAKIFAVAAGAGGSGPSAAVIADAVWDEILSGHADVGSTGEALDDASTGGGPTAAAIADAVWDETQSEHVAAGSTGESLDDAASGTAPTVGAIADAVWDELSAGHTSAGKAGEQLWTDIDTIYSLSAIIAVDTTTDIPALIAALPADNADAVWEEALLDHSSTSGSTAEALATAGGSGASAEAIADAVWDEVLTGATHNIQTSAGRRLRNLQEAGQYSDGEIWVDTVNGTAGTEPYENGTSSLPVLTWADALVISASAVGLKGFHIVNGSSITLTANSDGFTLHGGSWNLDLNGQSIDGMNVAGANITGIGTNGSFMPEFVRCHFMDVTLPPCHIYDSGFAGTFTFGEEGEFTIAHSQSSVPGIAAPIFDFGAGLNASQLSLREYSGGVDLRNMGQGTGVYNMSMEGNGQLIINANNIGGTIAIRGNFDLTDNSNDMMTLSQDARFTRSRVVGLIPPTTIEAVHTQTIMTMAAGAIDNPDAYNFQTAVIWDATSMPDEPCIRAIVDFQNIGSEVQQVEIAGTVTAGHWHITCDDDGGSPITTGEIAWNTDIAGINTALDAAFGASNIVAAGTFIVDQTLTFSGTDYIGFDQDACTVDITALTGATGDTITETLKGFKRKIILSAACQFDVVVGDPVEVRVAKMDVSGSGVVTAELTADSIDEIWDEGLVAHMIVGTAGRALADTVEDTDEIQGKLPTGDISDFDELTDAVEILDVVGTATTGTSASELIDDIWQELESAQTTPNSLGLALGTLDTSGISAIDATVTGNAALLAHGTYGLAQLVRSTTPANTLDINGTGEAGADVIRISGDATASDNFETMLDGVGGNTLSLGQLNIVASGNDAAMRLVGSGVGPGLYSSGGTSGNGATFLGGFVTGDGIYAVDLSGFGRGMLIQGGASFVGSPHAGKTGLIVSGQTTGDGMVINAGSTGDGLTFTSPGGDDIVADITGNLSGSVGSVTGLTPANVDTILSEIQHASYGLAQLTRSTTPANTLNITAGGEVEVDVVEISGSTTAADNLELFITGQAGVDARLDSLLIESSTGNAVTIRGGTGASAKGLWLTSGSSSGIPLYVSGTGASGVNIKTFGNTPAIVVEGGSTGAHAIQLRPSGTGDCIAMEPIFGGTGDGISWDNNTGDAFKVLDAGNLLVGDWLGNMTGSITGSLSGSVGSVDAAVATDAASRTASKADVSNLDVAVSSRSSHSAADVWSVATREVTGGTIDTTTDCTNCSSGGSSAEAVADAVWDELLAGHTTALTFGKAIADIEVDATTILADTNEIQASLPAGSLVDSAAVQAAATASLNAYDPPTNAEFEAGIAPLSTHAAADVWSVVTRSLTEGVSVNANLDKTGYSIAGTLNTLDDLNNLSSAESNAAADLAIADAGLAAFVVEWQSLTEVDGAGPAVQFTSEGLDQGPTATCASQVSVDNIPTNAELIARTIPSADYFDPAADTVARVTLVDTTTTNTDMRGTDSASTHTAADVWTSVTRSLSGPVETDSASREASKADVSGLLTTATFTGAGLSTHDASDVWSVASREVTGGTIDTNVDMRGTDDAALASVCTELRLSTLDPSGIPALLVAILVDTNAIDGKLPTGLMLDIDDINNALAAYDGPTKAEMDAGHAGLSTHDAAAVVTAMFAKVVDGTITYEKYLKAMQAVLYGDTVADGPDGINFLLQDDATPIVEIDYTGPGLRTVVVN